MTVARGLWDAVKHPRGGHGRFSSSRSLGGDRHEIPKATLGRPTRTARLRAAATRHHNAKLSAKVINKGLAVTPVEAGMKKARRLMGTQPARYDNSHNVIPESHQGKWVRVNWSHVPKQRRPR